MFDYVLSERNQRKKGKEITPRGLVIVKYKGNGANIIKQVTPHKIIGNLYDHGS